MSTSFPIEAPASVLQLLEKLHEKSLHQESKIAEGGRVFSSSILGDLEDGQEGHTAKETFDKLMRDKFIALDKDKCHFTYQLINAMGATNVVEAGTSFGVSTIYLALAVATTKARSGRPGIVIATEKESEKASVARGYWAECGATVDNEIDLREGDILETLKSDLPIVDLLLLDSKYASQMTDEYMLMSTIVWSALALPTLKLVQPHLRPGAVVLTDNTISGAAGYSDLLQYIRAPKNGFRSMTLPFTNGFEMSIYTPRA